MRTEFMAVCFPVVMTSSFLGASTESWSYQCSDTLFIWSKEGEITQVGLLPQQKKPMRGYIFIVSWCRYRNPGDEGEKLVFIIIISVI